MMHKTDRDPPQEDFSFNRKEQLCVWHTPQSDEVAEMRSRIQ